MQTLGRTATLGLVLLLAGCGGEDDQMPGGAGGTMAGTGGVTSGTGGVSNMGGSVSNMGGSVSGTGASSSVTAGCPTPGPTLPWIGPWMYGPNPGPCTYQDANVVMTYVYEGTTLVRAEGDDGRDETYTRDAQGRIISRDDGTFRFDYDYSFPSGHIETVTQNGEVLQVTEYTVSAEGYPIHFSSDSGLTGTYVYEDCRLTRFEAPTAANPFVLDYVYDAAGNLIRREPRGTDDTGWVAFDYSCWDQ
jgi:hypothetical protein